MHWRRIDSTRLQDCRVFEVRRVRFEPPDGGPPASFYSIASPNWINVIPLTPDGQVVMVRQYRFGIQDVTLEIPGGMCDGDEPPVDAARRELLEETGCEAPHLEELGWVHPNPAIQTNRCYTYLARDVVRTGPPKPDPYEAFEQVQVALEDIPDLIRRREITHALVVTAFQLFETARR